MKKAALHNLGCKVNAYETEAMQQLLERAGYEIVPFTEMADVYVINTCTVTAVADKKSRQMLHRARAKNPQAIVVAAGCYADTGEEKLKADKKVDVIIRNKDKARLLEKIAECEQKRSAGEGEQWLPENRPEDSQELFIERTQDHTRAFLKVQDGCNQFCSYCIIPYARGRITSRREEDVLREVRALAESGCREVVLTGIHLSSYGRDRQESPEEALLSLITRVCAVSGIERVRLGSLEPKIITGEFVSGLSGLREFCPHFHLSLQSGCDATLRRMNRRYTTAEYAEGCKLLRGAFPHPAITTDVIVGFPGETEEEFAETEAFLARIHFYEMHIFKYSRRQGTRAAVMPDQIPEEVKAERSARLIAMAAEMSEEFRRYYVGREQQVLLEQPEEIGGRLYYTGYNREYVKLACPAGEESIAPNRLVSGVVEGPLAPGIYGLQSYYSQPTCPPFL